MAPRIPWPVLPAAQAWEVCGLHPRDGTEAPWRARLRHCQGLGVLLQPLSDRESIPPAEGTAADPWGGRGAEAAVPPEGPPALPGLCPRCFVVLSLLPGKVSAALLELQGRAQGCSQGCSAPRCHICGEGTGGPLWLLSGDPNPQDLRLALPCRVQR